MLKIKNQNINRYNNMIISNLQIQSKCVSQGFACDTHFQNVIITIFECILNSNIQSKFFHKLKH